MFQTSGTKTITNKTKKCKSRSVSEDCVRSVSRKVSNTVLIQDHHMTEPVGEVVLDQHRETKVL